MKMYFRRMAIRTMIPVVWGLFKDRPSSTLLRFSSTEADSAWQFLHVLDAAEDIELRKELFNNALEEVHHASEFEAMSKQCGAKLISRQAPERVALYDPKKPFSHFLACVYVGESDVYQQFSAYSAAVRQVLTGQRRKRNFFDEAKEDEDGHLNLAKAALCKEFGSARLANREILKIRLKRGYEAWLRFSKRLGELSSSGLLSVLYFLAGPALFVTCRRRLAGVKKGDAQETRGAARERHPPAPAAAKEAAADGRGV
jgi:hypothetical protein